MLRAEQSAPKRPCLLCTAACANFAQQNTTAADSAPTIKRYDTLASEMIPCEEEIRVTSYDDENTVTAQLLST